MSLLPSFQENPRHEAYNFAMLVGDVSCFFIGISFLDSTTALPAIVHRLGGGGVLLGILLAARQACYYLPQLFVAHYLQGRSVYKPFIVRVVLLGRVGFLSAALAIYLFGKTAPEIALGVLALAYMVSWVGDGMGSVPWTALVGKVVSAQRRGRLFATTQVVSGLGRLLASAVVATLLAGRVLAFPFSDAALVFICSVFLLISWGFLAAIREPVPPILEKPSEDMAKRGFVSYLSQLPARLKDRPDFARLAAAQVLGSAASASAPFLILYSAGAAMPARLAATEWLTTGGLPGLFLAVQTIGLLLLAPVWGTLTDKRGPRVALLGVFVVSLLSPIAALLAGRAGASSMLFFLLAYLTYGAIQDGWITITNYLLEAVPSDEQPTYIGLMNAVSAPALLLPVGAGLAAEYVGVPAVFVCASLLLLIGFIVALGLPDTRRLAVTAQNDGA